MNAIDKLSRQAINDEAALWHARLDSGTADEQAFEVWRSADPFHAAAFARIAATAETLDGLRDIDLSQDPDLKPQIRPSRRIFMQWAAGGTVVAAGVGVWMASQSKAHASTAIGGRKTISLPDGGRLDLNTDTRVSWKFDKTSRRIWLEHGEIGIVVPTDPRPCTLYAGGRDVKVGNGDVNARLRDKALDLTVLKGDCLVTSSAGGENKVVPVKVSAGEGALAGASDTHVRKITDSDLQFTSGWRNDELVFNGQSLGVAVDEYNRYLKDKIVIVDPQLSSLRLGGRFNTHDPKDFLVSLQSSFAIHVNTGESGAVMLSR